MDDTYNAPGTRGKSDEMQIGGVETQKPALNRVGTLRRLGYYHCNLILKEHDPWLEQVY
ncbi:hypothetical protein IFT74_19380 [Oxalobacteraceae sp. CFBP 8755]|nr:hypothetical protein [Oxalobacteraceae sp. CFBP 8753]MBD8633529.1 hypothetical protein [Oxalobacteraceae sp. CFBP 8755]